MSTLRMKRIMIRFGNKLIVHKLFSLKSYLRIIITNDLKQVY